MSQSGYIATIMQAFAALDETAAYDLTADPAMLATFCNAWKISEARDFLSRTKSPTELKANMTGLWVTANLGFLEGVLSVPPYKTATGAPRVPYPPPTRPPTTGASRSW